MQNILLLFPRTFFLFIVSIIFSFSQLFFVSAEEKLPLCEGLIGKAKYDCQVKTYCTRNYKPFNVSYLPEKYFFPPSGTAENTKDPFDESKKIYRNNQNTIYKCSLIRIQKRSITILQKNLLLTDKTGNLTAAIQSKLQLQLKKIQVVAKKSKCKDGNPGKSYGKKELLRESTYEICKYSYYLDYLKGYYSNINNLSLNSDSPGSRSSQILDISLTLNTIQDKISKEEAHSYNMFHVAFQSYIDYETNFPIHLLLTFIKEDFNIYRKKLYQVLSPINQVVYKISNAMAAP